MSERVQWVGKMLAPTRIGRLTRLRALGAASFTRRPLVYRPSSSLSDKKPWRVFGYSWGDKALIDKEDRRLALEQSEAISPELLDVTVTEAIGRDDGRTLRMLLSNADKGGNVSSSLLQKAWIYSISTREGLDRKTGAMVLQLALSGGTATSPVVAEEEHCQDILDGLIRQCKWFQSAIVAEFMIRNDMKFSGDRELFFITAGLMKSETGAARTLQLLTEVIRHRRSDLDTLFNYTKVTRLSLSLHDSSTSASSSKSPPASKLGEGPLQDLSKVLLENMSADTPWYSFSGSKMFVALACASKHFDLATDFIRKSVDVGTQAQIAGHPLHGRLDVLDMLRSFSQGAGKASKDPQGFKHQDRDRSCEVSTLILDLAVDYLRKDRLAAASILGSPLKGVEFLKMYWVLAQRAERAPLLRGDMDLSDDAIDGGSGSSSSALAAESISDSYPRQHYHKAKGPDGGESGDEDSLRRLRHDPVLASSYSQLVSFMKDEAAEQMTSSPAPGFQRRSFRYLCDYLGLRHKVVQLITEKSGGVGDTYGVKVWKQDLRRMGIQPPSLSDILISDMKKGPQARRLTPPPRHWDVVSSTLLDNAEDKDVRSIATMTTLGMHRSYPSNEWGLLFLDLIRDSEEGAILSSTGLLRNVIDMGARRNDIYGILEILYANEEAAYQYPAAGEQSALLSRVAEEREDAATAAEKSRRTFYAAFDDPEEARAAERTLELAASLQGEEYKGGNVGASYWDSPAAFRLPVPSSNISSSQDSSIKGPLRQRDWNQACRAAYHSRLSEISASSFREAFTEVIHLMRDAQVDLDESLMRTLLRFLIYTGQDSDLTQRILRRLAKDKNIQVSHIECVSLTSVMLRRVPELQQGEGRINLARPLYKSPNYLFVYPAAVSYMFDVVLKNAEFLGTDFLSEFERAWKKTHALEGRRRLWQLLSDTLKDEADGGRRQELIMAKEEARNCIVMLSVYSSYLVGANGISKEGMLSGSSSSFREAFDLLYSAETMIQEAENLN